MRTLRFYGSGDDLFCIDGGVRGEPDEISPERCVAITSSEGGFIVNAVYSPGNNGCWAIGVSQLRENAPLPIWPIRFEMGKPSGKSPSAYTVALVVETPDDASMLIVGG